MQLFMVSSIADWLSASRTSSCHWIVPKRSNNSKLTPCDVTLITGNVRVRRLHPLVRTGSLPLPLHQQNRATTQPRHPTPPQPVEPIQASEQTASSLKRKGNAAASRASAITAA